MRLFDDETILLTTDSNDVTLTTHRIRSDFGSSSNASLTSMMLENVSSIQLNSTSYPMLIGIGLLMIVGGGVMFSNDRGNTSAGSVGLILAGIGALVFYLYSRKHTCIVASDGGSRMVFSTTNMKRIALIDFIDKVEEAKLKRVQAGFQSFDK